MLATLQRSRGRGQEILIDVLLTLIALATSLPAGIHCTAVFVLQSGIFSRLGAVADIFLFYGGAKTK